MTDFETFPDPFLSIYQSAVTAVGRKLYQTDTSSKSRTVQERGGIQRSAASRTKALATEIARREAARSAGAVPVERGTIQRELNAGDRFRVCAEAAYRYMKARVSGDAAAFAQLRAEFKMGDCDPQWIETIEEHLKYYGIDGKRREVPYRRAATVGSGVISLKPNARVALIGDWGTGEPPAVSVLREVAKLKPDAVIHLGDVYYSGTPDECQINFRELMDRVLRTGNPELPVFTLSGNHDMYSGGLGYYELIDQLNPISSRQAASFFSLRTSDAAWQFLAMDTGLHDNNPMTVSTAVTHIETDELVWLGQRMTEFGGRTILLSHHQLFSAFSPIGVARDDGSRSAINPNLLEVYKQLSAKGRIPAWFWGHEHTCSIYKPFASLERGRCLGHGAVPVSSVDKIYKPVEKLDATPELLDKSELRLQGAVYAHGFALLELKANAIEATYYQDVGGSASEMFFETIS